MKRPISAVADNLEFRNAKSIIVKTNNKIKFNLLYDKNRSLQKNKMNKLERLVRKNIYIKFKKNWIIYKSNIKLFHGKSDLSSF